MEELMNKFHLHGHASFLVPPRDPRALARAYQENIERKKLLNRR